MGRLWSPPGHIILSVTVVYATLLDEGTNLCPVRTMHRILAENAEMKERRNQPRHPEHLQME